MNRIELSSSAWEADALPLCYIRINKPIGLELPQTVKRNKAQTITKSQKGLCKKRRCLWQFLTAAQ